MEKSLLIKFSPSDIKTHKVPSSSEEVSSHLRLCDLLNLPVIDGVDDVPHLQQLGGWAVSSHLLHTDEQFVLHDGVLQGDTPLLPEGGPLHVLIPGSRTH